MPIWLFVILGVFLILYITRRIQEKRTLEKNKRIWIASFGNDHDARQISEETYEKIAHYFYLNESDDAVDDRTFSELNMKEIFAGMDRCFSFCGREQLYAILRLPLFDLAQLERREADIQTLSDEESLRVLLQECLSGMDADAAMPLSDCLSKLDSVKSKSLLPDYGFILLTIASTVLLFTVNVVGVLAFCGAMFFSIIYYYYEKRQIAPYLKVFREILKMQNAGLSILAHKDAMLDVLQSGKAQEGTLGERIHRIESCTNTLRPMQKWAFLLVGGRNMTGSLFDVILDYFRMLWHFDIIRFYQMLELAEKHRQDIQELSTQIGTIDALISIASYRKSLPMMCVPSIIEGNRFFEVTKLWHPLKKECVPSDLSTKKGILITGANASGKSTFLRSCAIAAIFAQTIHAVPAESYRASMCKVMTSMSLSDDLLRGESYYIAEIKSIKRMLDECKGSKMILCMIDEVLRGTNTAERIAAATQILKSFTKDHVICFAATHDLELSYLLESEYDNYHFTGLVENDKIIFPYTLMRGRATERNAISLLRLIGYDEEIVEKASKACGRFLETGTWEV